MKGMNVQKKIIDAAVKLFAKKGFFETTVDDIARGAKVAKGTVYLYFKDKPDLYMSIIDEHFTGAIKFLREINEENITSTEKLSKITHNWLDYMLKFKREFPMFSMENINMAKKIMKMMQPTIFKHIEEIINLIGRIVQKGIDNGEFRKIEPRIGAVYFLNNIRTAFLCHLFYSEIKNPEGEIMNILFSGLKRRRK